MTMNNISTSGGISLPCSQPLRQLAFREANPTYLEIFPEKKCLKDLFYFRMYKFRESLQSLNFERLILDYKRSNQNAKAKALD